MGMIEFDAKQFESSLNDIAQNQIPFATALALTRTAQKVKDAIRGTMQVSFDRPTSYTLNSLYLKPATKSDLSAEVRVKSSGGTGLPASVWLQPEIDGGMRQAKGSELGLRSRGLLPGGMFWVPGAGAKLDQYGNISRGQMSTILAALPKGGKGVRTKRAAKQADTLFVGKPAGGRLPLGVYQRTSAGHLKPLLIFVNSPKYSTRIPYMQISTTVYTTSFQGEFNQALKEAFATAR